MSAPSFNPLQNQFPQQPGAFGSPSGGFSFGAPMPTGGFGMPPGSQGFPPPQDMFAQQGMGLPQAPVAQQAGTPGKGVYQHASGGFADTNDGLDTGSGGGILSKIFSLKGLLVAGAAAAGAYALHHFNIWPFSKSEPEPTALKDLEAGTKDGLKALPGKIAGAVDEAKDAKNEDDLTKVEDAFNKHFEDFANLKLEEGPQAALNGIKETRQALFTAKRDALADPEHAKLGQEKLAELEGKIAEADRAYQTKVVDELNKPDEPKVEEPHDDEEDEHGGGFGH